MGETTAAGVRRTLRGAIGEVGLRVRVSRTACLLLSVLLLALVLGIWLWVESTDGTKQAELGGGLISTGVFALLLLFAEQAISRQAADVRAAVSLAASPPPGVDVAAPSHRDEEVRQASSERPKAEELTPRHRYRAELEGWIQDPARVDALQLRLRVFRDEEYFQFFTITVPGPTFRVSIHSADASGITFPQVQRAIAANALEEIRRRISSGEAPLANPTHAIDLLADVAYAIREARGHSAAPFAEGETVAEWTQ